MVKKFLIQGIALIILIFTALAFSAGRFPDLLNQNQNLTEISVKNIKLKVEVADSQEKRKKGLGGRDNLASASGMLFTFQKTGYYNFWMKGMKIPIDIIWIKEAQVVDIHKNVSPEDQSIFTPKVGVDSVLEVNGGFSDNYGIMIGDSITKH